MKSKALKHQLSILLFCDSFPPEICSTANLMKDLSYSLSNQGHNVTVMTFEPHGRVMSTFGKSEISNSLEPVEVIRLEAPETHNKGYIKRGINTTLASLKIVRDASRRLVGRHFDLCLAYSPPVQYALSVLKLSKKLGSSSLLLLRDLFPKVAVDLGILNNRLITKYYNMKEANLYDEADHIFAQSESNASYLLSQKGVSADKVSVLYNWIDLKTFDSSDFRDFRSEFGIENKFVCLYGGTLGPAQGLEIILDSAELLRDEKEILFLIVGNGRSRDKMAEEIHIRKLENVLLHDYVNASEFPSLVKSADVGLMPLSQKNKTALIPGKIVSYMAGSIPIIAALNKGNEDTARIIEESHCGEYVFSGNTQGFSDLIMKYRSMRAKLKEMGKNGRNYVERNFDVETAINKVISVFADLQG